MEYKVEGARPRGRPKKREKKLYKKTVRHVNWTRRMPWIVKDGGSRQGMTDDYDRCEWMNVSSDTGSPGLSSRKSIEP